jgi:PAS domain S-box-containing protein
MFIQTAYPHRLIWFLAGLTAIFLFTRLSPAFLLPGGAEIMPLSLHIVVETFAIVVSMLVFGITWNTYPEDRSTNTLILGCGFLLVGMLDFGHMVSYPGMPDFVTPSGTEKGIQFWLLARASAALVLLAVAFRSTQSLADSRLRLVMLMGSLAAAALAYWLVLFNGNAWPHTYIDGRLTTFKVMAEYAIIAVLFVAGILFFRGVHRADSHYLDAANLATACFVTILSELCFARYRAIDDVFSFLGHVYKVIAYVFIYRAVFTTSVREPFLKLKQAEGDLNVSQAMLRSIIDHAPVSIFWKDRNSRFLGANDLLLHDAGLSHAQQLIGKDDYAFFPAEQAARFQAEDREVMKTGCAKLNIKEPITTADGRQLWLLTNKVPLFGKKGDVVGVLGAYIDYTAMKEAEQRLEQSNAQLRELTIRREEAREEERKRIARDLHDELGQILTALRMDISMLRIRFGADNPLLAEQVKSILSALDLTIQGVRNVASRLRPSVLDMGIAAALEWQVAEFAKRSDIQFNLNIDEPSIILDAERSTAIFRIVQESITNVMRHAQAKVVSISLRREDACYVLTIADDGIGFESEKSGKRTFGLMGIRERTLTLGGTVEIKSAPGKGVQITVCIPVEKAKVEND